MITLRGIAPVGPGAVVGYYVDDTPLGSSSNYGGAHEFGLDLMPYDVERIEILRGPQGTLYGAGAMGGLLKYVLRRPSVNTFEAWAGATTFGIASASDFGWGVRGGANVPLAQDRVGLWGSYFEQQTPGYVDNARPANRISTT
jgi:outer membrane receptor protein involved in Fe transport